MLAGDEGCRCAYVSFISYLVVWCLVVPGPAKMAAEAGNIGEARKDLVQRLAAAPPTDPNRRVF